jgi:diguanylate cyclase (GGDEF)-like protein
MGGEEFAVLLADTDAGGAQVVADRMLQKVRDLQLQAEGKLVHLTCSIGLVTTVPHRTKSRENVIEEADRALYRAKNGGRDRLSVAQVSSELQPLSSIS